MLGGNTRAALLDLIFLGTTWADLAENDSSSPATTFDLSLHTADPGSSGSMATSEVAYTSYARQTINRNSGAFTRTANSVSPNADVNFPIGTGGSGVITHFSLGKSGGGATDILFSGVVTPNIASGSGIRPIILAASTFSLT